MYYLEILKALVCFYCSVIECHYAFQVALVYPNNDPVMFMVAFYGCLLAEVIPVPIEVPLTRKVTLLNLRGMQPDVTWWASRFLDQLTQLQHLKGLPWLLRQSRICLQYRRPGLGRFCGGGHGNLPQYSCPENPMDRGAWRATVHGVPKSRTRLHVLSTHHKTLKNSLIIFLST